MTPEDWSANCRIDFREQASRAANVNSSAGWRVRSRSSIALQHRSTCRWTSAARHSSGEYGQRSSAYRPEGPRPTRRSPAASARHQRCAQSQRHAHRTELRSGFPATASCAPTEASRATDGAWRGRRNCSSGNRAEQFVTESRPQFAGRVSRPRLRIQEASRFGHCARTALSMPRPTPCGPGWKMCSSAGTRAWRSAR